MRNRWGIVVVALAALTAVGASASPVGAAVEVAGPQSAEQRHVRRLLFDLQNDGDPALATVDLGVEIFYGTNAGNPAGVVRAMQEVPEGANATVEDLFAAVLRRSPDAADRHFFRQRLLRIGRQKVAADLLASDELHSRQGGGTDGGWVDALYRDALGRPADAAGKRFFLDQLAAGRTRGSIASFFTGGDEGRRALVRRLMAELLRRPADAGSVAFYAGRIAAGWRVEQVVASIATSSEYVAKARTVPPEEPIVVLRSGNELRFTTTRGAAGRTVAVTGLADGEQLLALDVRPSTSVLYGMTSQDRLVAIATDGTADVIGTVPLPADGLGLGMDFDPVDDVLHVVVNNNVKVVDPDTGEALAAPLIAGGAYTDAIAFGRWSGEEGDDVDELAIRHDGGTLVRLDTGTDTGTATTIGRLHVAAKNTNGFDVSQATGSAYALLDMGQEGVGVFEIDTATGEPRMTAGLAEVGVLGMAVLGGTTTPTEVGYAATAYGTGSFPKIQRVKGRQLVGPASNVQGMDAQTNLVGLDVDPGGGGLYGIGTNGQVYALPVPGQPGDPIVAEKRGPRLDGFVAGEGVGFDIDPVTGHLVVTNGDALYRVRLSDGVVIGDGATPGTPGTLVYADGDPAEGETPVIAGLGHTNSQRHVGEAPDPPATTTLYGVDQVRGTIVRIGAGGVVTTLGEPFLPGYTFEGIVGFDISGAPGQRAWAVMTSTGGQAISSYDLSTGQMLTLTNLTDTPQILYTAFALA